jgi:predicted nucleic acid-binding protein
VKWLREEPGTDRARELLERQARGEVQLAVPGLFPYELLDVARRQRGVEYTERLWDLLRSAGLFVAGFDDAFVAEMLRWSARLGCSVYDAAAPALASMAQCSLVSADATAHSAVPGVVIIE